MSENCGHNECSLGEKKQVPELRRPRPLVGTAIQQ